MSINGFYAAYLTGSTGQGLVMLVFRNGIIVGVDTAGAKYDGSYADTGSGFATRLKVSIPPNTFLVQGIRTGTATDDSQLEFLLPIDFLSRPFIRVNAKHGPVNTKLVKLRDLDD